MKSVLASQVTKALLLSFLATSFVACKTVEQGSDFSSRAPASSSLVSGKTSLQQSRSANPQGPGDGSGGNGVGGKAYESYIVDIKKLPEFEKYIAPAFDKLNDSKEDSNRKKSSEILVETKTWYIAPVKLKPIDKSVLGVSFSKDKTEQLAIQTKNAIWIDQQKWDALKKPEDRAMLLVHEITMQIYLMQFEDLASLCTQAQSDCGDNSKLTGFKFYQPTPRRALTNDDYDNIRAATFWLANNAGNATTLQIRQMLGSKKFDQRFFGPKALSYLTDDGSAGNLVRYNAEDAPLSLSRAQVLNKMPDKCYAVHSNVHFDCTITTTPTPVDGMSGVKISVAGKNFSLETVVVAGTGSSQKDESLNDAFQMFLYGSTSCQIGSVYQRVSLYALDEKFNQTSAREVLALTFAPQVVFESKGFQTSLAKAKVTSLETDTIIAYRSDVPTDIDYLAQTTNFWADYTTSGYCK